MTNHIGSISSGTMRPEDLLGAFANELHHLSQQAAKGFAATATCYSDKISYEEFFQWFDAQSKRDQLIGQARTVDPDSEDACAIIEELTSWLNEFAAPYFYFGAHPGDGADYGFWLSDSFEEEFDGLKVDDTSEVPADYCGEVLHVNDHGNATLYSASNGELKEIWAIV